MLLPDRQARWAILALLWYRLRPIALTSLLRTSLAMCMRHLAFGRWFGQTRRRAYAFSDSSKRDAGSRPQLAKTMNVQDLKRALPTSTAPLVPAVGERPTTRFMGSDTAADIVEAEILNGFRAWRVWTILGWDDIRQRYRRSILGPFWITLSMGVFILLLGVIYGRLFHMDLPTYLPYLSLGFIVWGFMSAVANDSCVAFHESGRIIKQIKLPFAIYIFRAVYRNFIVFLHTIIIFIPDCDLFSNGAKLEHPSRPPRPFPRCRQRRLGRHCSGDF